MGAEGGASGIGVSVEGASGGHRGGALSENVLPIQT